MFHLLKQLKQNLQLLIVSYQIETIEYNVVDIILRAYKLQTCIVILKLESKQKH